MRELTVSFGVRPGQLSPSASASAKNKALSHEPASARRWCGVCTNTVSLAHIAGESNQTQEKNNARISTLEAFSGNRAGHEELGLAVPTPIRRCRGRGAHASGRKLC